MNPSTNDDFWNWLPIAYRDGDQGDEPKFTKWNMEVAYVAGRDAAMAAAQSQGAEK